MLEKTPESALDCKEIKSVHPKGNQSWIFTWKTDAEAEAPILWPPDAKYCLIGKDPDVGQNRRQVVKGWQDEMVGWHHWLDEHACEQALGAVDGQGNLECCSPWGCKELNTTEQLNWTDTTVKQKLFKWMNECIKSSVNEIIKLSRVSTDI